MAVTVPEIADIKDEKSLELRLLDKPPEWAQAIAARIALRVAPITWAAADISDERITARQVQELILMSFRACFISLAARRYALKDMAEFADQAALPTSVPSDLADEGANIPSEAAMWNVRHLMMAHTASITASDAAAAVAADGDDAVLHAVAAAKTAAGVDSASGSKTATAARANYLSVSSRLWESIRGDCTRLEQYSTIRVISAANLTKAMMFEPLWLMENGTRGLPSLELPKRYGIELNKFANSELAKNTAFGLIVDWYKHVLTYKYSAEASLFGERADIAIATMPPGEWKGDPIEVMERVARLAGWSRGKTPASDGKSAATPGGAASPNGSATGGRPVKIPVQTVREKLVANRAPLQASAHSAILQVSEYREKVRGNNRLEVEFREGLLGFLDELSTDIEDLVEIVPVPDTADVSEEKAEKAASWLSRFTGRAKENFPRYFEAEHFGDLTPPVAIILTCGAIGGMLGGPLGFGAGSFLGQLIAKEAKPKDASEQIKNMFDEPSPPSE